MTIAIVVFAILLRYYVTCKSHRTVLQRMVLVFTAVTILLQALLAVQFEHYFSYNGQTEFCVVIGFLNQWMSSLVYTFAFGITLYLLYIVYVKLKRRPRPSAKSSPHFQPLMETLFYVIMMFSPLLYLWVPFINRGYGLDVAFCWIKSVNENDCTSSDSFDTDFLFGISAVIVVFSLLCIIIVAVLYCVVICKYKQVAARPVLSLLCRTLFMMGILVSRLLIATLGLIIRVIAGDARQSMYSKWTFFAVFIPVAYVIVPLSLLVYTCAIRKQRKRNNSCYVACCLKKHKTHQDIDQLSEGSATNAQSVHQYVRSYTYWSVPYTNGFTSVGIERGSSVELGLTAPERHPVSSSTSDGGYGSHVSSPPRVQ